MSKKALIILADGFEEIEAVTCIDILRRAGTKTVVAGLTTKKVTGSRKIVIQSDMLLSEAASGFDALILPGGTEGAKKLAASGLVKSLIKTFFDKGLLVAAICAAPAVVLAPSGILEKKRATCYPGMEKSFSSGIKHTTQSVVSDNNIITSQGPGTALEFALKIVEKLINKEISKKVKNAALVK